MTRRCSHCSNNGHNARTCPTRVGSGSGGGGGGGGVRLFGVKLTDGDVSFMKKSASMGNLSLYHSSPIPNSPESDPFREPGSDRVVDGYLSDDPNHASCSANRPSERKKGKPWTEDEHRLFLIGLQTLGKGDWRGIARNYVMSRTPTQVASHSQKYFIRQSNATRRKRRSSLFDMVPDMVTEEPETVPEEQFSSAPAEPRETETTASIPSLDLSLNTEAEPMEATSTEPSNETQEPSVSPDDMAPAMPAFFLPVPYAPFWTPIPIEDNKQEIPNHRVLKPIPMLRKEPVTVNELVGLSRLNLREGENGHVNLLGAPSRQSAFQANAPLPRGSELEEGMNSLVTVVFNLFEGEMEY